MGEQHDTVARERALRAWFTAGADPVMRQIDGLDIGWGGVQRWLTARMPHPGAGPHLDFACGYGTFLAQLGWRFPEAQLVGLNIDYRGPHALAPRLLSQAGVSALLVQADARQMPFTGGHFSSVSCFLGLQDIEIGFGEPGVRAALAEAVRVLRSGGTLVLADEFSSERLAGLLSGLPLDLVERSERELCVRWDREVAQAATQLYADGWVAQMRLPHDDPTARREAYRSNLAGMQSEMEEQMARQGCYVPFGPVRMVVAHRL
jgi:ubiquinone/menaquinone biosynthesis C-methylase UbiE